MFIFTSVIYHFSTKRVFGDPNIAEMLESMIEALKNPYSISPSTQILDYSIGSHFY
jgi:hypothetical protein